jgi:hypothetical protein
MNYGQHQQLNIDPEMMPKSVDPRTRGPEDYLITADRPLDPAENLYTITRLYLPPVTTGGS